MVPSKITGYDLILFEKTSASNQHVKDTMLGHDEKVRELDSAFVLFKIC